MPQAAKKRLMWTLAAAVLFAAFLLLALPFVASTRIVTDRIAGELSAISGYRVQLRDAPEIDVWPTFSARLRSVVMEAPASSPLAPDIEAELVTANLDAWSALRGDVRFRSMSVTRPTLRFPSLATAAQQSFPATSRVGRAVARARQAGQADGEAKAVGMRDEPALGTITIENGRIEFADAPEASLTSVDATFIWPRLLQPMRLAGMAVWNGEPVRYSLQGDNGLALLAGMQTGIDLHLESKLAEASFAGTLEAGKPALAEGQLRLSSPSLKTAMKWAGGPVAGLTPAGEITLAAALTSAAGRVKLDDVRLSIEGQSGAGALEIGMDSAGPSVSGTLAFGSLDLTPLVPAATAPSLVAAGNMPAVESGLSGPFLLDLRLSADTAMLGPVRLSKAAATLNASPELTAFDVSDAAALGGTIQAGFRSPRGGGPTEVSLRGVDIDMALFAEAVGATKHQPSGKATLNAMIKGPGDGWRQIIEKGSGTVSLKLKNGAINDIDRAAFVERARTGGFFGLGEVAGDNLAIGEAEVRAVLTDGIARIEKCDVRSNDADLAISGIMPLADRGLALSGRITSPETGEDTPTTFFIGGSWTSPFFYSVGPASP